MKEEAWKSWNYYTESLPLCRQILFYSDRGRIHEDELQKYLSDYQISLPGPLYCCLVIHMSSSQIPENEFLFLAVCTKTGRRPSGEKMEGKISLPWKQRSVCPDKQ